MVSALTTLGNIFFVSYDNNGEINRNNADCDTWSTCEDLPLSSLHGSAADNTPGYSRVLEMLFYMSAINYIYKAAKIR